MVKKSILKLIVFIYIISSTLCAFTDSMVEKENYRYESAYTVDTKLICKNNTEFIGIWLKPKVTNISYVNMDVKLMEMGSSTSIKSWSKKVYKDSTGNFVFENNTSIT